MPIKRNGLGKGLDSLIPDKNVKPEAEAKVSAEKLKNKNPKDEQADQANIYDNPTGELLLNINEVEPNRSQPRKEFDEDTLLELADSVRQYGILQPLIVQKNKGYYEIIAGERRWRAAKLAGLKEVPVIIKEYTSQQVVEISLIENIQRENLNPIEEAMAFKRLLEEFNLKQDEVAERVSKSRTAVTNSMRLLKLCDEVQQMVIDEMISTGHARALLSIEDTEQQYTVAQKIFDEKLSVRDVEKLVKNLNKPKTEKVKAEKNKSLEYIYQDMAEKMKESLGTKVNIVSKENGSGKIEIEFFSHDDFDRLKEILLK